MTSKHAVTHPYHLVHPSPWPLCTAVVLFGAAMSGVLFMHEHPYAMWGLGASMAGILFVMFVWWRDVIREARRDHAHTHAVQHGLRIGMAMFILSEVMFFFAFFFSFFKAWLDPVALLDGYWAVAQGVWPPSNIHPLDPWDLPLTNTLILLLSGTTVTWAHYAVLQGQRRPLIQALACTVLLGVSFTLLQAIEYHHASFGFKDGVYPSNFFMATGFHGFHVIVGTLFLGVCLQRACCNHFSKQSHLGMECAAWYWHFVDVVWLFLFVFVYVLSR